MIYERLSDHENMTATEELIADYLLTCDDLKHKSARQIATEVATAPSTVTRFVKKLGFSSYQRFIEAFEEERLQRIKQQSIDPDYPFGSQDRNNIIAQRIGHLYKDIIDDVLHYMTHDRISRVLSIMRKADRYVLVSAGIQRELAKTFEEKMLTIGKNVIVTDHAYQAFTIASLSDVSTVFILISYSGKTEQIIRIARYLKEHNIPCVALTRYGDYELSRLADSVLYVSSNESLYQNLGNYTMNVSTLLILDILYTAIFNEDHFHNKQKRVETSGFDYYRKQGE